MNETRDRFWWLAASVALFTLGALVVGELLANGLAGALRVLLIAGVSAGGLFALLVINEGDA
jgi:hypothetical protein